VKQTFVVGTHPLSRGLALQAVQAAPDGYCVTVGEATRTLEQNARLWASLSEVARQVDWYGKKLSPEDWKAVFTASLKKQNVVPGIDGGFVVLGTSTSRMTKGELSELLELVYAFGAEHDVIFQDEREAA
jgi:hypothetical protein